MTYDTPPQGSLDDFEDMLAGFDRIIHDKGLQQQLLDAGLLTRVEPETARDCQCSHPKDRHYFGDRTMGTPCMAGDDHNTGCGCKKYRPVLMQEADR